MAGRPDHNTIFREGVDRVPAEAKAFPGLVYPVDEPECRRVKTRLPSEGPAGRGAEAPLYHNCHRLQQLSDCSNAGAIGRFQMQCFGSGPPFSPHKLEPDELSKSRWATEA